MGTMGKHRAELARRGRIVEERITAVCLALDAIAEVGEDARARRKDTIKQLDALSARLQGLGLGSL